MPTISFPQPSQGVPSGVNKNLPFPALYTAMKWNEESWMRGQLTCALPNPWCEWCVKVDHNTRVYVPCSFRTVVWVLLLPTRTTNHLSYLGAPRRSGVRRSPHFFLGHVSLHLNSIYSRTLSIQSPMGPKNLAVSMEWPHYRGRVKFHDFIRVVMKSTPYVTFAPLEQ